VEIPGVTAVSRDAFGEKLRNLIVRRVSAAAQPVGLYVERELRHRPLFQQVESPPRRAFGTGPPPIDAEKGDVGSEGIIAQIVSELCREQPKLILNHPGPDEIRRTKMRRFIIVTDFIGSGKRVCDYLDAAWRVRSVRSWWSTRATKGLSFEVVSYSASEQGTYSVAQHSTAPLLRVAVACPTIDSIRPIKSGEAVAALCEKYSPVSAAKFPPLGFGDVGALIAFAHSVPNNTPAILHKRSASWVPLFTNRVTATARSTFGSPDEEEEVRQKLLGLRQSRLAVSDWLAVATPVYRNRLLVLAALGRAPRTVESVSGRLGLTFMEVEAALSEASRNGWVDSSYHVTDAGHAELEAARRSRSTTKALPPLPDVFYCPTSLRAPRERLVDVGSRGPTPASGSPTIR
jgi:hypothetical protein